MMAVVLGLSLGGLAAIAGQCPKTGDTKGSTAELPPPPVDLPAVPAKVSSPATVPPPLPDLPPAPPAKVEPIPTPPVLPDAIPSLPPPMTKPETPVVPPPSVIPAGGLEPPKLEPAVPNPPASQPDKASSPMPVLPPAVDHTLDQPSPTTSSAPTAALPPATVSAAAVHQHKFRILLRVGEGEPNFEVRCGDDLVLKVICQKVDLKSPEQGNGPTMVRASGQVRFAGFGAEGTSEELSFLAGTAEVLLSGDVKIRVKDKLGRVESEFFTDAVKYKLDPCK
jgi:hypothetical protein